MTALAMAHVSTANANAKMDGEDKTAAKGTSSMVLSCLTIRLNATMAGQAMIAMNFYAKTIVMATESAEMGNASVNLTNGWEKPAISKSALITALKMENV